MKKLSLIFIALATLLLFSFFSFVYATVSGGTIAGTGASELVAGKTDAHYVVGFGTDVSNTATTITVTFPSGYTITNGSLPTSTAICNGACSANGVITITGTGDATVASVTGNSGARTIAIALDTPADLSGGVSFQILEGIKNPTTSGATGTFSITTDAATEVAQSGIAAVTITPATVSKLVFTGQPSDAGAINGNVINGIAFATQPIVSAEDTYGNVVTSFSGSVTIGLNSGVGSLSGTSTMAASSGVANFSGKGLAYFATADQESFSLLASSTGLTTGTSSARTADVIATKFLVTLNTNNPITGYADPLTLRAADAQNLADVNYNPTGLTYTFKDSATNLLSTHISAGGVSPTIPSSATVSSTFSGGIAVLSTFTLTKIENLGTITVSDGTLSGISESVNVIAPGGAGGSYTPSQAVMPTASPIAGTYFSEKSVSLSASGSQSIHYTIDNSIPNCSSGMTYSGPISINDSKTIKAISCYSDGNISSVASFAYIISEGNIENEDYSESNQESSNNSSERTSSASAIEPLQQLPANPTVSDLQNYISYLFGRVKILQQQLPSTGNSAYFARGLSVGAKGDDVTKLQNFLSKHPDIYPKGLVTGYYGQLTQEAVQKLQESQGIANKGDSGYGYVGPKTRAYLNQHFQD